MEEAATKPVLKPTFVALQETSSQFTSVLSRASSIPSPSARIAGLPARATSEVSSHARGPSVNDDAGDTIIGITCMLLVLCIAAVVGRVLARRISKLRLETDDYLALVGLVSSIPISRGGQLIKPYYFVSH